MIMATMLEITYDLALQFYYDLVPQLYGNEPPEVIKAIKAVDKARNPKVVGKARKLLELAVYFPIFGVFGYNKLVSQDPDIAGLPENWFYGFVLALSSEDITKLQNQLDKLIPILELALLEKDSEDRLWMRIRHSCLDC